MSNIPERDYIPMQPIQPQDRRTALDVYKERQETFYKEKIPAKNFDEAVTTSIEQMKKKYPQEADDLLNLQQTGQGTVSPTAQRFLNTNTRNALPSAKQSAQLNALDRRSQFAGLLTIASVGNSALNVLSRTMLGNGAYNAQVAGKVLSFEDQQRNWENLKRGVFLTGSIGSFAKVVGALGGGAAAPLTIAAVGLTLAGQITRIYGDNQALSGERKRQDSNAEYHRMAYGNIVTRGNR